MNIWREYIVGFVLKKFNSKFSMRDPRLVREVTPYIYPVVSPRRFGIFFKRHVSQMPTAFALVRFHYVKRTHMTALWTFQKIDVAPDNISRTFHTDFSGLSLFILLSLFATVKNRVGNASAVFFPPLKDCVIEAKWLGKPFGFVRYDFAKKCQKVARLSRRDNVLDIYFKRFWISLEI